MGRNLTFLGLPRYKLFGPTFGTASIPSMPPTALGTWEPWEIARISSPDFAKAYLDTRLEMPNAFNPDTFQVGGIAIVNHNLSVDARVRTMLLNAAAADYLPVRLAPDVRTVTGGSWTGAVTDVDEDPYAPDGNALSLTSIGGSVLFDFPTPARNPSVGADLQSFRFRCTYSVAPTAFVVELYEGGSQVAVLLVNLPTNGDPNIPDDAVFTVYWNAGQLSTASGANAQVKVSVTKDDVGDTFDLMALDWLPDLPLSAGAIIEDSGWVDPQADVFNANWGGTLPSTIGVAPQQTFVHLFSGNLSGVYRSVTFFRDPSNAAGYIDLGELVIGPTFTPQLNRDWGELVAFEATDRVFRGAGASRWGIRSEPLRRMPIPLASLSAGEAYALLDRIWRAGRLTPFVVAVMPDDSTERRHTSLYCCAENLPKLSGQDLEFRSVTLDVVEKV